MRTLMACRYALAVCAAAMFLPAANAFSQESDGLVEAVWKPQRVNFAYQGYSTFYSCSSLEEKLEAILISMGAREDLRVSGYGCDEQIGVARFQIVFNSPIEATPENLTALTDYDAHESLIARTRGEALASAADLERFPAVWKTVSIARDRDLNLGSGDCELVQQLRRQILPRMSVRIVTDRVRCSSAFGNIGPPRLTVSALVPVR
jgi:hypothetical protein